jgi:uncharacterized protein YndB with AHSA1/START domain
MGRITKETTVKAPPQAVFDYVSDLTKHPEWGQHRNVVVAQTAGPVKVGSRYDTTNHQFGTHMEPVTVTEYNPPTSFGYESTGTIGLVRHGFVVTPAGDATKLTKWMEVMKPSMLVKLFGAFILRSQPAALEEDLRRVKAKLEA